MSEVPLLSEFENVKRKSRNNKYDRASFRQKSISRTVLFFILVGAFVVSVRTIWIRLNRTKLDRIVELDVGKIQGVTITKGGVEADYFLSIPFAEPPIGDNRFEKTVPVKRWSDIKETIKIPPRCAPIIAAGQEPEISEDCLFLNVITPYDRSDELLPVLFVIHGGAFEAGAADIFTISSNRALSFLKNGVIIVAIQYRLAVFGFASTGNNDLPGNLGYFDQAEALSFIHRNIKAFGGDPSKITIIGCSAGGASVTSLSISPYTRNLVHQTIANSGSAFSVWATSDVVVENTQKLIEVLGLKPNETTKQRLKRASTEEIYRAVGIIGTTHFGQNFGTFMPRIDGDFFPKDLPVLISESSPKSIMIGLTSEESLAWTLIPSTNSTFSQLVIPDSKIAKFSSKDLEGLIRQYLVLDSIYKNDTKSVQDIIFDFYSTPNSENAKSNLDNVFYLQRYTQILSDLQFNMAILWEILFRGFNKWTVFAYKSPYFNEAIIPRRCPVKKSFHGTDQEYADVILGEDDTYQFDVDYRMEIMSIKSLLNFIKTGDPSITGFQWNATTPITPLRYANFLPNPELKNGLFEDRAKFYTKLTQTYGYDLVRMRPKAGNIAFYDTLKSIIEKQDNTNDF